MKNYLLTLSQAEMHLVAHALRQAIRADKDALASNPTRRAILEKMDDAPEIKSEDIDKSESESIHGLNGLPIDSEIECYGFGASPMRCIIISSQRKNGTYCVASKNDLSNYQSISPDDICKVISVSKRDDSLTPRIDPREGYDRETSETWNYSHAAGYAD